MISIENLIVNKHNNKILDIKKIDLGNERFVGIWGENGAGKSTLVKCILGIEDYKGKIELKFNNSNAQVIMQNNRYPAYAKVKDIILLILDIKTLEPVHEFIKYIDFEKCLEKDVDVLSVGEYQKLNLVLALNLNPTLLIVDEVTTGLDYLTRKKIIGYLKNYLNKNDCRFLIISHYQEELEQLTNKTIVLENGKLLGLCDSNKIEEYIGGNMDETIK